MNRTVACVLSGVHVRVNPGHVVRHIRVDVGHAAPGTARPERRQASQLPAPARPALEGPAAVTLESAQLCLYYFT